MHNVIKGRKKRLCMASVRSQQNRLWNRSKILYSVLGYFLRFSVLLFLAVFVSALKTPFGAFESYFYGLGSTVTHKKFFLFDTQKLPKNREFLAWDLFCNIDMELETWLEHATYTELRIFSQKFYKVIQRVIMHIDDKQYLSYIITAFWAYKKAHYTLVGIVCLYKQYSVE